MFDVGRKVMHIGVVVPPIGAQMLFDGWSLDNDGKDHFINEPLVMLIGATEADR